MAQAETDEALAAAGKDVGTPIIHFEPPDGVASFGLAIGRLPADKHAVALWDHVVRIGAVAPASPSSSAPCVNCPSYPVWALPRARWARPRGLARRESSYERSAGVS